MCGNESFIIYRHLSILKEETKLKYQKCDQILLPSTTLNIIPEAFTSVKTHTSGLLSDDSTQKHYSIQNLYLRHANIEFQFDNNTTQLSPNDAIRDWVGNER